MCVQCGRDQRIINGKHNQRKLNSLVLPREKIPQNEAQKETLRQEEDQNLFWQDAQP